MTNKNNKKDMKPEDLFLDLLNERLMTKCEKCNGKGHKSNCCGNIFTIKEYLKLIKKNTIKDPIFVSFCKDKYNHLSEEEKINKEKKFKLKNIEEIDFDSLESDDKEYQKIIKIFSNYKCKICGGNGHIDSQCGTLWILGKDFEKGVFHKIWKSYKKLLITPNKYKN